MVLPAMRGDAQTQWLYSSTGTMGVTTACESAEFSGVPRLVCDGFVTSAAAFCCLVDANNPTMQSPHRRQTLLSRSYAFHYLFI